jgi:hypothetical protein
MKMILRGLGFSALATWFRALYLFTFDVHTNPRISEPALGKIYPLDNHGQIAYIDFDQKCALDALYLLAVILFMLCFLIHKWKRLEID